MTIDPTSTPRSATSPWLLLRLEGLAVAVTAIWLFASTDVSWWWLVGLGLAPDVGRAGYAAGPDVGARTYNLTHSLLGPLALLAVGLVASAGLSGNLPVALAAIWVAHCGIDRAAGYGLKYPGAPMPTHVQRV